MARYFEIIFGLTISQLVVGLVAGLTALLIFNAIAVPLAVALIFLDDGGDR